MPTNVSDGLLMIRALTGLFAIRCNPAAFRKGDSGLDPIWNGLLTTSRVAIPVAISLALGLVVVLAFFAVTSSGAEAAPKKSNPTLLTAGGLDPFVLSNNNSMWHDFGDLTITFTLGKEAIVQANYEIAMHNGNNHPVTRLDVDGMSPVHSRTITGNTRFLGNSNTWLTTLPKGTHTIKVQYRTPAGGTNVPGTNAWHNRSLSLLIFGGHVNDDKSSDDGSSGDKDSSSK